MLRELAKDKDTKFEARWPKLIALIEGFFLLFFHAVVVVRDVLGRTR